MHSCAVNTVCTSQLRAALRSFHAVTRSKPSSTSIFTFFSVFLMSPRAPRSDGRWRSRLS